MSTPLTASKLAFEHWCQIQGIEYRRVREAKAQWRPRLLRWRARFTLGALNPVFHGFRPGTAMNVFGCAASPMVEQQNGTLLTSFALFAPLNAMTISSLCLCSMAVGGRRDDLGARRVLCRPGPH